MNLRVRLLAGVFVGAVAGSAVALALPVDGVAPRPEPASPVRPAPVDVTRKPQPPESGVALVWTPGRLLNGLEASVDLIEGVRRVARVDAGTASVVQTSDARGVVIDEPAAGFAIPVEIAVFAAEDLSAVAPGVRLPGEGEVVLSETSARVRRLGVGGKLSFADGVTLTVVDVVDDGSVGAAEIVVTRVQGLAGSVPRYLLVDFEGSRSEVEAAVRQAAGLGVALRFRGPDETPYLRHGDAVLPQAVLKERFGEFAVTEGSTFGIEPRWVEANLVTVDVPLIGMTTCHRLVVPLLVEAMERIAEIDPSLIDPDRYGGCWNPRTIGGTDSLSRHAWGVAVDLNYLASDPSSAATVAPVVVDVMRSVGFAWGGEWLEPDPAHFEWTGSG